LRGFANLVAEFFPEEGIEDHRQFQRRLTEVHLSQLTWILNYLGGRPHELFLWLLRRYQFENLKVLFRGFHARRGPQEIGRYLITVPEYFALPVEQMLSAATADDFASAIPDASLQRVAAESVPAYREKGKPFFFEAALDRSFYSTLLRLADEPSLEDLASCLPMLALDANVYLVMLVLRARFNYDAGFEEIEPFVKIRRALPVAVLRSVHAAERPSDSVGALPKDLRRAVTGSVETVEDIERGLMSYFYDRANATFYGAGITLAVPVAFYYLKRIELANLIRLAEAYRYEMSPGEMRRSLVPPVE
jgi:vacuolar-type H+-ATPase subunit C/Vma6